MHPAAAPKKIDLLAAHKAEYAAPKKPVVLDTTPAAYLSLAGSGQPGDALFSSQIGALYSLAFTVKMTRKFSGETDYTIGKLEALWPQMPVAGISAVWQWQLLIRTPDFVSEAELKSAATKLISKGQPEIVKAVSLVRLAEGRCVQMLHVGPYDQEATTFSVMSAFARARGLTASGLPHHEIYLSDPRRVPPERLRTLLRLPVSSAKS